LTLSWPRVKRPVAVVFDTEMVAPEKGMILHVSLPGAAGLKPFSRHFPGESPFAAVQGCNAKGQTAPFISLSLKEEIWGYGLRCSQTDGLQLFVRPHPRLSGISPDQPLKGLRVMLDAGHGGESFGERGASGVLEKDLNLVQAAWLERDLERMGAQVRQVRREDVDVALDQRVNLALAWNPDLFISLHHNSVPYEIDPLSKSGPTVYYHYPNSLRLATTVAKAMTEKFAAERRPWIVKGNLRVNRNLSICPSILIESAFISNPEDETKLRRTGTIESEAQTIAQALKTFMAEQ
jgi:N-acetylmuramoyl-L-alanine amidase